MNQIRELDSQEIDLVNGGWGFVIFIFAADIALIGGMIGFHDAISHR